MVVAGWVTPRAIFCLVLDQFVAEKLIVVFPGFSTEVDHRLRGVIVIVEVGVFLEVEGVVLVHVAPAFPDGGMVVSLVLLDAKGACSGEAEVAFGGAAGAVFTVSKSAVFLLGVEDGLECGF